MVICVIPLSLETIQMDAQKFLPPLGEAESKVLEVEDFLGCRIWNFKFR